MSAWPDRPSLGKGRGTGRGRSGLRARISTARGGARIPAACRTSRRAVVSRVAAIGGLRGPACRHYRNRWSEHWPAEPNSGQRPRADKQSRPWPDRPRRSADKHLLPACCRTGQPLPEHHTNQRPADKRCQPPERPSCHTRLPAELPLRPRHSCQPGRVAAPAPVEGYEAGCRHRPTDA